jgi:hypothetical protein
MSDEDDDDITRNYHGGNPQSAAANRRTRKNRDRARIYAFLYRRASLGATCDEAEVALDMTHQTCSARFSDMKRDEVIIETNERRLTRSGSWAAVCIIAPQPQDPVPAVAERLLL